MKNRHLFLLLVLLGAVFVAWCLAFTGCGTDIFEGCSYEVGDLVDFTPAEDRTLAKYLSTYNNCNEKISIELVSFESLSRGRKVQIRIVEVKSKYSYIGIIN